MLTHLLDLEVLLRLLALQGQQGQQGLGFPAALVLQYRLLVLADQPDQPDQPDLQFQRKN
jgi:hypothetical protein